MTVCPLCTTHSALPRAPALPLPLPTACRRAHADHAYLPRASLGPRARARDCCRARRRRRKTNKSQDRAARCVYYGPRDLTRPTGLLGVPVVLGAWRAACLPGCPVSRIVMARVHMASVGAGSTHGGRRRGWVGVGGEGGGAPAHDMIPLLAGAPQRAASNRVSRSVPRYATPRHATSLHRAAHIECSRCTSVPLKSAIVMLWGYTVLRLSPPPPSFRLEVGSSTVNLRAAARALNLSQTNLNQPASAATMAYLT